MQTFTSQAPKHFMSCATYTGTFSLKTKCSNFCGGALHLLIKVHV